MSPNDTAAQAVEYLCPRHTHLDSLLAQVGDGDRDAFAVLYDELSQTVYAMSLHMGHEPRVAAQLTHDVFLRAWRQARAYEPTAESAWTWIRAIALAEVNSPKDPEEHRPVQETRLGWFEEGRIRTAPEDRPGTVGNQTAPR